MLACLRKLLKIPSTSLKLSKMYICTVEYHSGLSLVGTHTHFHTVKMTLLIGFWRIVAVNLDHITHTTVDSVVWIGIGHGRSQPRFTTQVLFVSRTSKTRYDFSMLSGSKTSTDCYSTSEMNDFSQPGESFFRWIFSLSGHVHRHTVISHSGVCM